MALLLDCSGSMHVSDQNGSRYIDQMIKCATNLIDDINDKDRVSLAFFATEVSEVQSFDGHEKAQLKAAIKQGVDHYGNTNMAAGLERMIQFLREEKSRPRNILLFTDGSPNKGQRGRVQELASRCAEEGISLSVFGFNDELRLDYMSQLSTLGNGQLLRGRNIREMRNEFRMFVQDAQRVGVTDLTLHIELDAALVPHELLRSKPQNQHLMTLSANQHQISVPLGNVDAGSWQTLILMVSTQRNQLRSIGEQQNLIRTRMTYYIPSEKREYTTEGSFSIEIRQKAELNIKVDKGIQLAMVKSREQDFQKLNHQQDPQRSVEYAKAIIKSCDAIATTEAREISQNFNRALIQLEQRGDFDRQALQKALNDVSYASTAVGARQPGYTDYPSPNGNSETQGTRVPIDSATRGRSRSSKNDSKTRSSGPETPSPRPRRKSRRNVRTFNI